ncbi:MAG TPA: hypothetical protein VN579_08950 [Bryobacteraceae bacterium]|nr:hypothetical protein [Bryobacteraceae bacterium]
MKLHGGRRLLTIVAEADGAERELRAPVGVSTDLGVPREVVKTELSCRTK